MAAATNKDETSVLTVGQGVGGTHGPCYGPSGRMQEHNDRPQDKKSVLLFPFGPLPQFLSLRAEKIHSVIWNCEDSLEG